MVCSLCVKNHSTHVPIRNINAKMNPLVSVIIPIYNAEKYLEECIQSVINQSFTDFELLLINDGSIDTSGAICDKYALADTRIKVFHKENAGVSSARNLGIENAKGTADWQNRGIMNF